MAAAAQALAEKRANRENYDADLTTFAADCLTIRPKKGGNTLLRFNDVQLELHAQLEDQLARTGRVRALVLKMRQPGISTYVEARFYHKTSRNKGVRAFILTHHQEATDNVFEMAQRFHDHNPHAPPTAASNAKELNFDGLDSGFAVGTAGAKGIGRGHTFQLFHGSEVAWWVNAVEHFSGAMQAVPNTPGTEVILESTANGIGGLFYNKCKAAVRGDDEYILIFIPWFSHAEYSGEPPSDWTPPTEFIEYGNLHDVTKAQLYWAWRKNADQAAAEGLPTDQLCWRFRQEYPATAEEAFRASREGSFIAGSIVARARRFKAGDQSHAPLVLGCDFATGGEGEGGDKNCFIDRQGRAAGRRVYERFHDGNTVSVAGKLARIIDRERPAMCFLDRGGGGAAVYDILGSRNYGRVLTLIDFGSTPHDHRRYANKRAEMWGDTRDWLADPGGAEIPDDDALDGDLTAPTAEEDLHQRVKLQKKDKIRALLGFSPDGGDALALTHAEPIMQDDDDERDDLLTDTTRSVAGGY